MRLPGINKKKKKRNNRIKPLEKTFREIFSNNVRSIDQWVSQRQHHWSIVGLTEATSWISCDFKVKFPQARFVVLSSSSNTTLFQMKKECKWHLFMYRIRPQMQIDVEFIHAGRKANCFKDALATSGVDRSSPLLVPSCNLFSLSFIGGIVLLHGPFISLFSLFFWYKTLIPL